MPCWGVLRSAFPASNRSHLCTVSSSFQYETISSLNRDCKGVRQRGSFMTWPAVITPRVGLTYFSFSCNFEHLSSGRVKSNGQHARTERQTCQATARDELSNPYNFGFQCNERYLEWDDSAQRRLIKIYIAKELDQTVEWVDGKLMELATLLPDLIFKLDRLKADLVLRLVADTPAVAAKLVAFRGLLPMLDLSRVLAQYPWLLLDLEPQRLQRQLEELRAALPGVSVEALVEREPMLLLADVSAVLGELRRILPAGTDPVGVLLADPTVVLDMKAAGLPASLEVDDGIKA